MAFFKLETLTRKAVARTYQSLWKQVGAVCDLFLPTECRNYLMAAGYDLNWTPHALWSATPKACQAAPKCCHSGR